jgi:uncharacterized membrane protein YfhO
LVAPAPKSELLDVDAPARGWLLVTDRWAQGWQACVNGQPQPVWIGQFIFRAVEVEPGANRVEFSYRPFGYPRLLALSWSVLGLVACCCLARWAWSLQARGGRK